MIGDIHGRYDKLDALHALILDDVRKTTPRHCQVIYLGDFVDRGPQSAEVLECLVQNPLGDLPTIHLKGNHEAMLLDFLDHPETGASWFKAGGGATVASYGLGWRSGNGLPRLAEELAAAIPETHKTFLRSLQLYHQAGDILCVHAGIRPGVPLARQREDDLLWIRQPFLSSSHNREMLVVHGHTPTPDGPDQHPTRIGIDTGAYFTGVLTCLVFDREKRYFLATEGDEHG